MKLLIILLTITLSGCAPYTTKYYVKKDCGMELVAKIEQDTLGSANMEHDGAKYATDTRNKPWLTNVAEQATNLLVLKEVN